MRKKRSRTLSFSDEEWAVLTASAELGGLNRSLKVSQMAKADLEKYPAPKAAEALAKAREEIAAGA